MIATRRILLASAIAPLGLMLPLFVFAYFMWSYMGIEREPNSQLASLSPLLMATLSGLQFYLPLAVLYAVVGLVLRQLRALSRSALLLLGAIASVALGYWFGCAWQESCLTAEAIQAFAIQSGICFVSFSALSVLWWHIAARNSYRPAQPQHNGET